MRCEMSNFKIPKVSPTTNKTIRFPDDVIEAVEAAIVGSGCSFSAFVIVMPVAERSKSATEISL